MSDPWSLRNIPEETQHLIEAIQQRRGISKSDVLRLALTSGTLLEAAKLGPDLDGTVCGREATELTKTLRWHLSAPVDLLIEYGQHPYQILLKRREPSVYSPTEQQPSHQVFSKEEERIEGSLGEDISRLGIGIGFSEIWQGGE